MKEKNISEIDQREKESDDDDESQQNHLTKVRNKK
jgi:hypothetical protein